MRRQWTWLAVLVALIIGLALSGCAGSAGSWPTLLFENETLVYTPNWIPATDVHGAAVLAAGKVGDAAVRAAVGEITGKAPADVDVLLTSYDTTGALTVQVLQLKAPAFVTRYWGPTGKLGRWFAVNTERDLYLPDSAREWFALPNTNNAHYVSLYVLKPGTRVIYGYCADMTWDSVNFGPYATGGGPQIYAPDATVWTGQVELNPEVISLVSEVRHAE